MQNKKLRRFIGILRARLQGAEVGTTSVVIAYYLLLSLFPLLIVAGNILPYLNIDPASVIAYVETLLPQPVRPLLEPVIRSLLSQASGGLLSISILGTLWSASKGVSFLQKGMDKAYGIPKNSSSFVAKRLVSLITLLLVLLMLVAFALVYSFGQLLLETLAPQLPWAGSLLGFLGGLKWPVTLVFLFLMLLIVYRVTPDVQLKLKEAVPGALLATAGLFALVQAFTLYIRFSTATVSGYGALAGFIVLMFWLNFTAILVLLGAVLNAAIGEYRRGAPEEDKNLDRVDSALEKAAGSLKAKLRGLFGGKRNKK